MQRFKFQRVKTNLEVRMRSTIEIERDNGPSVRSLAFAPPQMTSRHAEKEHTNKQDEEGDVATPSRITNDPSRGRGKAPRASLNNFPTSTARHPETPPSHEGGTNKTVSVPLWPSNPRCQRPS